MIEYFNLLKYFVVVVDLVPYFIFHVVDVIPYEFFLYNFFDLIQTCRSNSILFPHFLPHKTLRLSVSPKTDSTQPEPDELVPPDHSNG